ncbi:MAG: coproporphyrinogen dehydrogenase HemZ [Clostridia bacterium]|nr:coproporphyrinogen dehydrogenase HemZ [Clostridia bacterium]
MKLYLKNHTERYPVEQLQLQLFAQEPSEFVTEPFEGDGTVSSLSKGRVWLTATAKVTYHGKTGFASQRVKLADADVRRTRRILQRSYYLAAVQVLEKEPAWGALSGVRPSKLSTKAMLEGASKTQAEKLLREVYFVSPARAKLCADASNYTVQAKSLLAPGDLSVYIGIPFCPTRCAYCSFVSESIERCGEFLPDYLECLLREVEYTGQLLKASGFHIRSIYMGGGTPTTLSSAQMERLLGKIQDSFDLSRSLEFTVEGGRPDTLDEEKLRVIKEGGATRISINPQTMSDAVLKAVGRRHTAQQVVEAFEQARRAGFDDINMDLIAGLPGDTAQSFRDSLTRVLSLDPSNVTVHTLALKKGADLFQKRVGLPSAEDVSDMLDFTETTLRGAGFDPYYLYRQKYMSGSFENVGWCKPAYPGYYNIYMMEELHSILSLGGGGMNKINLPQEKLARFHNPKYPQDYISRIDTILQQKDEIFRLLAEAESI